MNILKQKDNYIIVEDNGLSGNYLIDGNILTDKGSDDVHIVNSEKDTVIESNNDGDNDTVSSLVSYVLGEHIENLTLEDVIKQEDGMLIYGNPKDNRWVLDTHQGDNGILKIINPKEYTSIDNETHYVSLDNINLRFYGTCGISSILNLLIVAGKIKNEEDRYQSTDNLIVGEIDKRETAILREVILNFDNEINISSNIEKSLGGIPEQGIYSLPNHSAILNHFNVGHYIIHNSSNFLERIGSAIKDGYGVIINVDSNVLWGKTNVATLANHDVFIVGVSYEKNTNNIKSFYIMDTGDDPLNLSLKEITFEKMKTIVTVSTSALITNEKIKNTDNNLNGTGNQLDNIIKGNQGLNILKGEAGDDVLIGNEGQDTLYGGADDDVLIAGIAKKTNESGEKEDLTNQELKNLVLTSNSEVKINSDNFESENEDENYLSGDTGKDLLIGDKGEDLLRGGDNDDILIGGKGFDRLFGENNNDVLIAGKVTESINLNSIYANKVCRLGFNPTIKGIKSKTELEKAA